jgi:23S rRNA pseudouridine1911/1915/1917 synthase
MLNQGYSYQVQLNKKAVGHTALSYMVQYYLHSSLQVWQDRFDKGEIFLDDQLANANDKLNQGQTLIWHRPPWIEEDVPTHYDIVFHDNDVLIVNKPSGLPTMPAGGFLENTLYSILRKHFPTANPIHRLGRGTSGLVVFSLNTTASSFLSKQWREQKVKKLYLALAEGIAQKDNYKISQAIGTKNHSKLGNIYAARDDGKTALSMASVLERYAHTTLFDVVIKTGRPHQIRIHLASIGHPLVGDPLYGIGGHIKTDALPGDEGYFLHARKLEFIHPTGRPLSVCAPLPDLFQALLRHPEFLALNSLYTTPLRVIARRS